MLTTRKLGDFRWLTIYEHCRPPVHVWQMDGCRNDTIGLSTATLGQSKKRRLEEYCFLYFRVGRYARHGVCML